MSKVAYLDNKSLLGMCYLRRDYADIKNRVLSETDSTFRFISSDGERFGYQIQNNIPLTKLYQFPCYVVKFAFSGVDTLHSEKQETLMNELCQMLRQDMENTRGYYNLRIPTHIVDLQKAVNANIERLIFCGGSVDEVLAVRSAAPTHKEGLKVFFAEEKYIREHESLLKEMAFVSFKSYQGQYHISPVTQEKAGLIYSNWVEDSMKSFREQSILIAKYHDDIVGYCTLGEDEFAIDAVLASVNEKIRGVGAYQTMIYSAMQYAHEKNKLFVSCTQFDNYIVQGTWSALGMRPFCSIYNIHYDNR